MPTLVQPFSLLQRTVHLGRSIFGGGWADKCAASALQPGGSFLPPHLTTTSVIGCPTQASLETVGRRIPFSLSASETVFRQDDGSIAEHYWPRKLPTKLPGPSCPRWWEQSIPTSWFCRNLGSRGCEQSIATLMSSRRNHSSNSNSNSNSVTKTKKKSPPSPSPSPSAPSPTSPPQARGKHAPGMPHLYDRTQALAALQGLVDKLGGIPKHKRKSEDKAGTGAGVVAGAGAEAEVVSSALKPIWGCVSAHRLCELVVDSNLDPWLVPRVATWAVSQPGWRDRQDTYIKLIDYVGGRDHRDATSALYRLAVTRGFLVNKLFLDTCWKYFVQWKLPEQVLDLFSTMGGRGVRATQKQYTMLLTMFRENIDLEGALRVLEAMKAGGADPPNAHHYTVVLKICGMIRDRERLEGLVVQMRDEGVEPTLVTHATLIHCYGLMDEPKLAGEVFKEMLRLGMVPTIQTFGAYHQILLQGGWGDGADRLLELVRGRTDLARDGSYYRLLLDGYGHGDSMKADMIRKTHREMMETGGTLEPRFYRNLFYALMNAHEAGVAHDVFWDVVGQGEVELCRRAYFVVHLALVNGRMGREAEGVRREALRRGFDLEGSREKMQDEIGGLLRRRNHKELRESLRRMRNGKGVVPFSMYLAVMDTENGWWDGWWEKSKRVPMLDVLEACGYETTAVVRLLLDAHVDDVDVWPDAIKALRRLWEVKGVEPTAILIVLMNLLHFVGLYSRASRVWAEAKAMKIGAPDLGGFKMVKERGPKRTDSALLGANEKEEVYMLDLQCCNLGAAKVVLSNELLLLRDPPPELEFQTVQIITGKERKSPKVGQSIVQQGVTEMLEKSGSPFVNNVEHSGMLVAHIADVQQWLQNSSVINTLEVCGG